MSTWYINPDSVVQDGRSLETGYHTFEDLHREETLSGTDTLTSPEHSYTIATNITVFDKNGESTLLDFCYGCLID